MMQKKKKQHNHIVKRDKGDTISKILGDMIQEARQRLLNLSYNKMLTNLDGTTSSWYKAQNSTFDSFQKSLNNVTSQEKKRIIRAVDGASNVLNLKSGQTKEIKREINLYFPKMSKAILNNHISNVASIGAKTYQSTYQSNVTDNLYKMIKDKIESTQNYGIVAYKNGRKVRWENYMEMKVRTDIQNDISKNMLKDGREIGYVFYLAAYFGDCAIDHADYQGKIYYDANYESIVPKDRLEEVRNYIISKKLISYQEITGAPVYLCTRPNCRHYFQLLSIDEVLGIINNKDLNEKREKLGLNFNGKYEPEKYEALKEQRYNERAIREWKGKLETDQKLLDKMPSNIPEKERLNLNSRITLEKRKIREWQKKQRELISNNKDTLQRNYDREIYGRMVSDFRIKEELKVVKTMSNRNYIFEKIKIETNIKDFTTIKNPSNKYSWEIRADGRIHALISHPELEKLVPNYVEETIKVLKIPDTIELDKKYSNTTTFIRKLDENHIFRVSVLIDQSENKVKSVRYQSIKKKKNQK